MAAITFGKSGLPRAGLRNCGMRDFKKLMCANSLYGGGPKTLLTDQHLLRTNLFFVTETSELRLAGLVSIDDSHWPRYTT